MSILRARRIFDSLQISVLVSPPLHAQTQSFQNNPADASKTYSQSLTLDHSAQTPPPIDPPTLPSLGLFPQCPNGHHQNQAHLPPPTSHSTHTPASSACQSQTAHLHAPKPAPLPLAQSIPPTFLPARSAPHTPPAPKHPDLHLFGIT